MVHVSCDMLSRRGFDSRFLNKRLKGADGELSKHAPRRDENGQRGNGAQHKRMEEVLSHAHLYLPFRLDE